MKKFVLVILIFSAFSTYCQRHSQERVDSLLACLPSVPDLTKIKIYIQAMNTLNLYDREEAFKLSKPAIELAEKIGSKTIAFGEVKNAIGRIYWRDRNFDVAIQYHTEAQQIFQRHNDSGNVALSYRYIAQDYADNGRYPEALKYLRMALSLHNQIGDRRGVAYEHELFAWVYEKQGDYLKASQSAYAELAVFDEIGAHNESALAAANVAELNIRLGNYQQALKLFQQSEKVYRKKGDQINIGYTHILRGKVYRLMSKFDESLASYDSARKIGIKFGDLSITAAAYQGEGDVYLGIGKIDQALIQYDQSAELFNKGVNKIELARVYCSIAECYRLQKRFELSKKYLNEALVLARTINSKALLKDYFQGIERLDSTMGNWKEAYFNLKDFITRRDSIFNEDNITKIAQLQLQYDFDKKEAAASLVQQAKDIRQQRQIVFLGVIALLVLLLAIVMYKNQKRVAEINSELKIKSESLEDENREKTGILKIVSHDLRAPFSKIKGLITLLKDDNLSEKDKELYFSYIQSSIIQGNYLIQQLLDAQSPIDHGQSNHTIHIKKFVDDFEQVCQRQLQAKDQKLHASVEVKPDLMTTDPQLLTRILDNLISNASKFSAQGKPIHLRVWSETQKINFSVRDEGPGISEFDQKKLFRKFQKLTPQPTGGENSHGLGLSITKSLVEKLQGSIAVKSKEGEGTEMIVSMPFIQP